MKVNMKKFAEWLADQGKIIRITPQYVIVHRRAGTFYEESWKPMGKNEKYTRKEAIQIYLCLSPEEKKKVDWISE
jgi:hypothetical protein